MGDMVTALAYWTSDFGLCGFCAGVLRLELRDC